MVKLTKIEFIVYINKYYSAKDTKYIRGFFSQKMSGVTHTCIQVTSWEFKDEPTRKQLVILANLILALIDGNVDGKVNVRFFNTDDQKPYEATNIYAVSREGALIWELPDQQMLEIRCTKASEEGIKYDTYLYTSHKAWCNALQTDIFPMSKPLWTNDQVIKYLNTWYDDLKTWYPEM